MKPLVIYHANCADGFGAAFAAWTELGDDAEYVPLKYEERADFDMARFDGRDVYILDFSFKSLQLHEIIERASSTVWLDHHSGAYEEVWGVKLLEQRQARVERGAKYTFKFDNTKSGAMIAWEYFHPNTPVPMLIQHIDDYDRWKFKLEGTKAFNKALWSYAPWSFEQWDYLFGTFSVNSGVHELVEEGVAIQRAHEQNVQSVVRGATMKCFMDTCLRDEDNLLQPVVLPGLAANCPAHLASDVGHTLANQSGTYGLLWSINKDGKCLCSLRSNGDYDVSAIAKVFGGGGHRNAAGFTTDPATLLGWLK